jgi:hypothetical protein
MGYRKLETEDIPLNHNSTTPSDPYPISLSDGKIIPDNKISKYLNDDFFYYINIYENIKEFGIPYKNWIEAPHWLLDMYKRLKQKEKQYENYLVNKQYRSN